MSESNARKRRRSKTVREQLFPISPFGKVVVALWPYKPAFNLADRVGCTERAANLWIEGKRRPSTRAIIVVMDEID